MTPIFLDHQSTTPLDRRVLEAMMPALTRVYGNPSSQFHDQGRQAAALVEQARSQVAALAGAPPEAVVFTSGATEANNLALLGAAAALAPGEVIASSIEHFSVLRPLDRLRGQGFRITLLPVDAGGLVDPQAVAAAIGPETRLVSIQAANPEIGSAQPLAEIGRLCRERGILFHTDAAAGAGLLPLDLESDQLDLITLSAHNFYGPKGVGALIVRPGVRLRPLLEGGGQEGGRRSGTENVPGIVGMGAAAALAAAERKERAGRLTALGRRLRHGLEERIRHIHFTGHPTRRLPGHVSFWVEFAEGESILLFLSLTGIMAASGSACASNIRGRDEEDLAASHVLTAVGVPSDICAGSITLSAGKDTTEAEVDTVVEKLPGIIERLWAMSPAYADHLKKGGTP